MPEIISRKEAVARGMKRYFTGKPCKWGHISERRVSIKSCVACGEARDRRRLPYLKTKKCLACERNFQTLDARQKICSITCVEVRAVDRAHRNYVNNSAAYKARASARQKTEDYRCYAKSYREKNREKSREYMAEYNRSHKDRRKRVTRAYRTKISDLLAVLKEEMPELLKEFGL